MEKQFLLKINFIRHGLTAGNETKKYIGRTDENLSEKGIDTLKNIKYPECDILFVSPMKRCIQTAEIIYPDKKYTICDDLRECDFGDFEGKNYQELKDNILYQKWIDSNGTDTFPNGESPENFKKRCVKAFLEIIKNTDSKNISFVVHGGTIMAILEKLSNKSFYEWHIENAHGFITEYDGEKINVWKKF
ncbi:MAG: histidine phosphatase family protein [Ruminococcus sp.]|nr:histidine phosphatase family protein [Ruminococcus sp.]